MAVGKARPIPHHLRGPLPPRPPPSSSPTPSSWPKYKRMVWTVAFAAVTIVGTIYGAGLKTRVEYKQEKEKFVEAPVEERVAALEQRRAQLVMHRGQVERKLVELRRKMVDEPQGRDVGEASGGK